MVVVSHLFFFFQINFREGMTRCESYPPCFGTIYFPIAPSFLFNITFSQFFKQEFTCFSLYCSPYYKYNLFSFLPEQTFFIFSPAIKLTSLL